MQARFVQLGNSIDYIPTESVEAGSVVILGQMTGITKTAIAPGETGAVAVNGVYEIVKKSEEIAMGASVYWDADAELATATASGNYYMGKAIRKAEAGDEEVLILLNISSDFTSAIVPSPQIPAIINKSGGTPGDVIEEVDLGVRDAVATLSVKINKILEILRNNHFMEE